jgi:hypothetical protein
MWHCRSAPAVKRAFASIWGTDDLVTSFDGMCVFRPWQIDETWKTIRSWYALSHLLIFISPE